MFKYIYTRRKKQNCNFKRYYYYYAGGIYHKRELNNYNRKRESLHAVGHHRNPGKPIRKDRLYIDLIE